MPPPHASEPDPASRCDWRAPAVGWELHGLLEACRAHRWSLHLIPVREGGLQVSVTRRAGGDRPDEVWCGPTSEDALAVAWRGVQRWARERAARGTA